ncbi:MAG: MBL fold metallo-hydrolase [Spirochaetota bacterium]|nr:MBL fold metallo-hydrolase [Spirochaetota bacterium]
MNGLKITFWGVRGSVPVPGPSTVKYGGNTACFDLKSDDGDWIIFDAGTGLRVLGQSLDLSKNYDIHLFISHPHWDHINGFPFFPPVYIPGNRVTIYGPGTFELSLEDIINGQMKYTYFPVRTAELNAEFKYKELKEESFTLGNLYVETHMLNHPVTCLGYKIKYRDKVFVYLGDNEPYYNVFNDNDNEVDHFAKDMNNRLAEFVKGADTLISDAQYIPSEYESKRGWGHSTTHDLVNMSIKSGVKKIFFFHHEPMRSDRELDFIVDHYRKKIKEKGYDIEIYAAMENATYDV